MKKAFLAFALIFAFIAPLNASAAIKAGGSCSKVGQTSTYAGKKYTCIKNGKKLVWNKGVATATPTPTPSATPTPTPSATPTPTPSATPTPTPSATPTPRPFDSTLPREGEICPKYYSDTIGYNSDKKFVVLGCDSNNFHWFVWPKGHPRFMELNPDTGIPVYQNLKNVQNPDKTKHIRSEKCAENAKREVGYNWDYSYVILFCNPNSGTYGAANLEAGDTRLVDQVTGKIFIDPRTTPPNPEIPYGIEYIAGPTVTLSPKQELSNSSNFANLELCKIADGDPQLQNMGVGFPIPSGRTNLSKPVKIQVLAVDFPDVQASSNPQTDYKAPVTAMKEFWERQASTGLKIDVIIPTSYLRMPNPIASYGLGNSLANFQGDNYWAWMREAIKLYDNQVDFTGVTTVILVVPLQTTPTQIGTWVVNTQVIFDTNEGKIYNTMYTGNGGQLDAPSWIHEYGHTLGLTDMRNTMDVTQQKPEGLGIYDIMGNGTAAPEIMAWSRFLIGLLNPNQVHCVTTGTPTYHWLSPLELQSSDVKTVLIKTGEFTAIAMESRRAYGYDGRIGTDAVGVLVYTIDSRIPYRRSPIFIVPPTRSTDRQWETDSALKLDEFVISNGWKITVVESGDFGDVVKVEKVG